MTASPSSPDSAAHDAPRRHRVRRGGSCLGTWLMLASADGAELAGACGFDVVVIDLEHAGKDWETVQHMIRAAEGADTLPLVRVSGRDDAEVLRALDAGAAGIVVPFVESADDARRVRALTRFGPVGHRRTCRFTRAAAFGARTADFEAFAVAANDAVLCIGQIESIAGVHAIDDVLGVEDAFDCLLIGRADLAGDLGLPGQLDHPDVVDAVEQVAAAVLAHPSIGLGIAVGSVAEGRAWLDRGVSLCMLPADVSTLVAGYRTAIDALRTSAAAVSPQRRRATFFEASEDRDPSTGPISARQEFPASVAEQVDLTAYYGGRVEVWPHVLDRDSDSISLVEFRFAPSLVVPRHRHDTDQVVFVLEGELRQGSRVMRAGAGYFMPATNTYTVTAGPDGCRFLEFRPSSSFATIFVEDDPATWRAGSAEQARSGA